MASALASHPCTVYVRAADSTIDQLQRLKMKYIPVLFLFLLLIASCGNNSKTEDQAYEQHKESLAEQEQKNPLHFLSVRGDHKKNLIGQTVVSGTISNKASVTAYKEVRVKMLCYKGSAMLEEHEDVFSDVIKPGTVEDFKIRYRLPKGTDSIALSLMSAAVAEAAAKP